MRRLDLRLGHELSDTLRERVIVRADLFLHYDISLRDAARKMGISHSTLHYDLRILLPKISKYRYEAVHKMLARHKLRAKRAFERTWSRNSTGKRPKAAAGNCTNNKREGAKV